ncbi:hypothetical protein BC834DRAFT_895103 [Gloeopeniophorella convolvens]|nr:hypothetical protein BC834DRAFT_895103 [Gloeopeniophorella convolvens]
MAYVSDGCFATTHQVFWLLSLGSSSSVDLGVTIPAVLVPVCQTDATRGRTGSSRWPVVASSATLRAPRDPIISGSTCAFALIRRRIVRFPAGDSFARSAMPNIAFQHSVCALRSTRDSLRQPSLFCCASAYLGNLFSCFDAPLTPALSSHLFRLDAADCAVRLSIHLRFNISATGIHRRRAPATGEARRQARVSILYWSRPAPGLLAAAGHISPWRMVSARHMEFRHEPDLSSQVARGAAPRYPRQGCRCHPSDEQHASYSTGLLPGAATRALAAQTTGTCMSFQRSHLQHGSLLSNEMFRNACWEARGWSRPSHVS